MGLKAVSEHNRQLVKQMIYSGKGSTEIMRATGVSRGFVCGMARALGIKMPRPGTKRPTPKATLTCEFCGSEFQRPTRVIRGEQVRSGRSRVGLYCSAGCFRRSQGYSSRDIATLRKLYLTHSNDEIAAIIGRNPSAIANKLSTLGLRRDNSVQRLIARLRKEIINVQKRR